MGASIVNSLVEWQITAKNTQSIAVNDAVVNFGLSSQTLSDIGYITPDALNAHLHQGSFDVPNMPSTRKINIQKGYNRLAADDTSDAINNTTNDMELPYQLNEEYEFALHNPARMIHLVISTATDYNLTTNWKYCDTSNATTCTSWVGFSGVVDSSLDSNDYAFKNLGNNTASWSMPTGGAWGRENHQSFSSYWLKVEVTAVAAGTNTIVPLGEQSWYETGEWWFHAETFAAGESIPFSLYTGGPATDTFHNYFPGFDGIITADDADLEPGSQWRFETSQNFKVDTNETGTVFGKGATFNLEYQSALTVGGNNTLTLTAPGSSNYYSGTWTHNEEDGTTGTYYSATAEESYSKSFYNASSNYITAREEDDADILSNTSSEVVSHKIGQAYDKVIDTTAAFGDKLNDPS